MINRARERARVFAQRQIPSSSTGNSSQTGDSSETVLSMINDSNRRALEGGNLEAMRWSFQPVDKKMLLPLPEDRLWEISCEVSCLSVFLFSYANKFKTGRVGGVYRPLSLPSSTPWPHIRVFKPSLPWSYFFGNEKPTGCTAHRRRGTENQHSKRPNGLSQAHAQYARNPCGPKNVGLGSFARKLGPHFHLHGRHSLPSRMC